MVKRILVFTLMFALVTACGPRKVVESRYPNGKPNVVKYYEKKDGKDQLVKEEVFYENQVRKMVGEYDNELRSGHWSVWYENGKLWSEGEYMKGKRNGPGMVYHPNGKKYIQSFYTNDQKSGTWTFYDTTGNLIKTVNFDLKQPADSTAAGIYHK